MGRQAHNSWVVLSPPFPERSGARHAFREHAQRLSELLSADDDGEDVDDALREAIGVRSSGERATALRAALCVLVDLARQRWSIRVTESGEVEVKRPAGDRLDPSREKARVRAQELVKRDEQLREPATRRFIRRMEQKSIHGGHFVSIYSLIRDGRELAASLRATRSLTGQERVFALKDVIDPYLQFVDKAECCEKTGLRLQDIWRYFRHTWTNQYTSTPGRSMGILVRDRAREYHPVIGIGSLGSPIVQIRERDAWIGWHPEAFVELALEQPTAQLGAWLLGTVDAAVVEVFVDDLIEAELLSVSELRAPSRALVERLASYAEVQRGLHHRLAKAQEVKSLMAVAKRENTAEAWQKVAETHLYRSKRALSLADMLRCRMTLSEHLGAAVTADGVRQIASTAEGRRVVKTVLRKAKADRVGIAMADITVCGAVAPYGPVLGGKLVSMLSASPEVVAAYRDKYRTEPSVIASSKAARPIVRPSALVFLGTTSLYGVGSSQYNRLRMPAERIGGAPGERLAFLELGKSEAYGTSQFSSDTVSALVSLVQQSGNGQRVNSIFGEGVSPKLRKVRDGLDALNLPADALLQHGRQRIVYGVPVVRNLREFLLGMDDEPEYLFEMEEPARSTDEIGRWWTERWLQRRIESDDVLARVEQHTLVRPIRHGARVVLPRIDDGQATLFDDLEY